MADVHAPRDQMLYGARVPGVIADTMTTDRPRDLLGRQVPRKSSAFHMFRAIPGLYERFTEIPTEFWAQDATPGGFGVATISCPCGQDHTVEVARLSEVDCERFFLYLGDRVMVANGHDKQATATLLTEAEAAALPESEPEPS